MPTRAAENPGVGTAAKQVAEHAGTLAKLGLELARLEAKRKAGAIGMLAGAAFVALYGLGFLLATIAVALATVVDAWLAVLIVTLVLFLVAGVLVALARARLKGGGTAGSENGNG
jgi:putative superfamily III holin-X